MWVLHGDSLRPCHEVCASLNFMACPMFYTYILRSLKDNKLYIGSTSNLKRRYKEHINGKSFATKGRLPINLIFYEAFINQKDAIRREKYFKTNPGKRTLKLMLRNYFK
jgi:putative endonuclease